MDPIDVRADSSFSQALRCVEYRLPKAQDYRPAGYVLALGLRYGLIGMATCHHLLVTSEPHEEARVLATAGCWPHLVEDHVRWDVAHRIPHATSPDFAGRIAELAAFPLRAYEPLYRKLCPLAIALDLVSDELIAENRALIVDGWGWFKRRTAIRFFQKGRIESVEYARHFFERREADLEEVPEIALIGE